MQDRALEVALVLAGLLCSYILYLTARQVVVYILGGVLFMSTAAFALVNGQVAERPLHKAGWYACTAGAFVLFMYWALTVVFRAPVPRKEMACGGVQYVQSHDEL